MPVNRVRKRRLIAIILMVSAVSIALILVLKALQQNINLFYTPSQIKTMLKIATVQTLIFLPVFLLGMVCIADDKLIKIQSIMKSKKRESSKVMPIRVASELPR